MAEKLPELIAEAEKQVGALPMPKDLAKQVKRYLRQHPQRSLGRCRRRDCAWRGGVTTRLRVEIWPLEMAHGAKEPTSSFAQDAQTRCGRKLGTRTN